MNRETSLYLDVVRFSAALVVFLGHVAGRRFTDGFLWQFSWFMDDAVIIFFVMSGFVIGYAADQREDTPSSYGVARAARIYSVAAPALAITFLLDDVGRSIRPELYSPIWGYVADGRLWQAVSGLLFVNQLWFLNISQGSDLSYWSLGYEVWYYAIFGLLTFARGRVRVAAVALALLVAGPKIVALFPLWLFGLLAYRLCARTNLGRSVGVALCFGALLLLVAFDGATIRYGQPVHFEIGNGQNLAKDYIVGTLFTAHLIGFRTISSWFAPMLNWAAGPVRWLAGATFTLYLVHLPVAQFLTTLAPWPPAAWGARLLIVGGTFAVVLVVAEFTERRKEPWRHAFSSLLEAVAPRSVKSAELSSQPPD